MTKFSEIWINEVRPLAVACICEPKLLKIIQKGETLELNHEDNEYLKSIQNKYKDIYGMFYIADMIWRVDSALEGASEVFAKIAVEQVYEVLNRESYFLNIFDGNKEDEEWIKRVALRDGLHKLIIG